MHNDAPNAHSPVCSTLHKMKVQLHDVSVGDVDGDGRVYSIMTGDEYTWENPVDNWKYKAWRESYIYGDSAKKKINYKELSEENIRWITMVD